MKPSVSRLVHYRPKKDACYAALVLFVEFDAISYHQDTGEELVRDVCVLKIFDPSGRDFNRTCGEGEEVGMWHWPERVE